MNESKAKEALRSKLHERWTSSTGLDCVINPCTFSSGRYHLCGYVRLPEGHLLHGKNYSDLVPPMLEATKEEVLKGTVGKRGIIDVFCLTLGAEMRVGTLFNVHGGITYSEDQACGEPKIDGEWWYGFDCGHSGDDPGMQDSEYVHAECESFAAQILSVGARAVPPEQPK